MLLAGLYDCVTLEGSNFIPNYLLHNRDLFLLKVEVNHYGLLRLLPPTPTQNSAGYMIDNQLFYPMTKL